VSESGLVGIPEIAYALPGRDIQTSAQLITGLLVIGQRDILNLGKGDGSRTDAMLKAFSA
jgi:hypothetical protein